MHFFCHIEHFLTIELLPVLGHYNVNLLLTILPFQALVVLSWGAPYVFVSFASLCPELKVH